MAMSYMTVYQQETPIRSKKYKIAPFESSCNRITYPVTGVHIVDMHNEANQMYLADRRLMHTIGLVFKCLHDLAPHTVCQQLERVLTGHSMTREERSEKSLLSLMA